MRELYEAKKRQRGREEAMKEMGDPVLRRWQSNLTEEMNKTPDPRKIIWYNDPEGNTGKTFIAKLLCLKHSAIRFENAKSADI